MLRKLAIAMFATTMLAAPVLAADAVKPAAAAAPKAPVATTSTPATPTPSKTDTQNPPVTNGTKTGAVTPDAKSGKTDKDTVVPPAKHVKTIKAAKHLKIIKVATRSHHHSHAWYMAHRDRHVVHTLTAKLSKPIKHVYVHRLHKEETPLVKANKDTANKATQ